MQADLTHAEALTAFRALARKIGPNCEIFPGLNVYSTEGALYTSVRADGLLGKASFAVKADSYRETIQKIEAEWASKADTHAAKTVREMALAIISITADVGECTDAALRAQFDAVDVIRYGKRACDEATEIAGLGPFSITTLGGANDAEAA